jgi:hypothetical protein
MATWFAWTGDGVVGIWQGAGGLGYGAVELDPNGVARAPIQTLFPDVPATHGTRLAVRQDTLAIVDQVSVGANQRQTCTLALARLPGLAPIGGPTPFSDPTEEESIVNEAHSCDVAPTADGFLTSWQQNVSRTSTAWSLFAQRFSPDGSPVGERITLTSGDMTKVLEQTSVTSDGGRVAIAYSVFGEPESALAVVDGDQVRTTSLAFAAPMLPPSPLSIGFAHGKLIARTATDLALLDWDGRIVEGPLTIGDSWIAGPLGRGYVTVSHPDFLVATALDSTLAPSSDPVGLSTERQASPHQLVYAPDGASTAAIYLENGLRFARLECADEPDPSIPPPGPPMCPVH